jgi:hypothetical protein
MAWVGGGPAWDLELFAKDCGFDGPPFRWDEDRRFLIRAELDEREVRHE